MITRQAGVQTRYDGSLSENRRRPTMNPDMVVIIMLVALVILLVVFIVGIVVGAKLARWGW